MQNTSIKRNLNMRVPPHPDFVITPKGNRIDISGNKWLIPVTTFTSEIRFEGRALKFLAPELRDYGFQRLSTVSESVSNTTLHIWTKVFDKFLYKSGYRDLDWKDLTIAIFEQFLNLLRNKGTGYKFWHIQTVINWLQLNHIGLINSEVAKEILSWTVEGNKKGEAVYLNDPYQGALTKEEILEIRKKALSPLSGTTLLERVVVLFFLETGQRNGQLSQLTVKDLRRQHLASTGVQSNGYKPERYIVSMPSNKYSTGKRDISISKELFDLCLALKRQNEQYKHQFTPPEYTSLPLLILDPKTVNIARAWFDANQKRWDEIRIPNSWELNSIVKCFCEKNDVLDRFGEPINIFARRFRRTTATRMVEQGASPRSVAAFLDHSDTQQVEVYFEFHRHRQQEKLEQVAGPFYRSLNESIKGNLIANATEARNPSEILPVFDSDSQDIIPGGNCGRDMNDQPVCLESQIHACYGCNHFQPYISDIHKKVLSNIKQRKTQLVQIQGRNKGRIQDGLDKLEAEVTQVIDAVEEEKTRRSINV